jgi:hypothetical protein
MLHNNYLSHFKKFKTMKKIQYIIVPALALCMFAACNTEVKGPSQAELDAQVDAKVKSATDQLKSECDSRIMTAAQLKKDSILVKLGKQKPAPVAPAKAAPPKQNPPKQNPPKVDPPKVDPPKADPPKGGLKGLSDQSKNENGGGKGLKGLSDQNKQKATEEGKKGGLKGLQDKK